LKVALALEHACLAGKGNAAARESATGVLHEVEASNRRCLILLRDDPGGHRPHFRGLYVQTNSTSTSPKALPSSPPSEAEEAGLEKAGTTKNGMEHRGDNGGGNRGSGDGGGGGGKLVRVFGNGPSEFVLSNATSYYSWSDVDRRFCKVDTVGPATRCSKAKKTAASSDTARDHWSSTENGGSRSRSRRMMPQQQQQQQQQTSLSMSSASLGPTIIAIGFNPISHKFKLRKQQFADNSEKNGASSMPTFKIYEPSSSSVIRNHDDDDE